MNTLSPLAILAVALCVGEPAAATDRPATPALMALSALEILHAELPNPDATLDRVIGRAAASVAFPRDAAGDTLVTVIDQVLSAGPTGEVARARAEIEAAAARYTTVDAEVISRFTSELLSRVRTALQREGEEAFLDELLGEAAAATGLEELTGASLIRNLVSIGARVLRPRPPLKIEGLSEGVFVLAVNLQSSSEVEFQGYEFRGSRWTSKTLELGTNYIVEALGKSMAIRRRFRRIVPCYNVGELRPLMADYLLVLDISGQSWREVEDTRKTAIRPEEILALPRNRQADTARRRGDRAMELTLTLESRVEALPAGDRIWASKYTVARYRDELVRRVAASSRDAVFDGILDLVASQTRVELSKLR